jgi:hypothetical protein
VKQGRPLLGRPPAYYSYSSHSSPPFVFALRTARLRTQVRKTVSGQSTVHNRWTVRLSPATPSVQFKPSLRPFTCQAMAQAQNTSEGSGRVCPAGICQAETTGPVRQV